MLSQELRPSTFEEMAGQDENKKILKAVIKSPEKAPKCLIFAGAFGSGKTTSARILARALNNIKDKDYDLLSSQFYYEFDSTVIGNVETIRNLRDQFLVSYGDYYRVIVFDETHMVSNAAQNALLKVLEEATGKVFFIMCLDEDTLVCTKDGFKRIKDVSEGDIISTEDGEFPVKHKFYNGEREVFNVVTKRGNTLRVTDNHKIRVFDGRDFVWTEVKDLRVGDKVPLHLRYNNTESTCNLSPKQCEFLGKMHGDGWWTQNTNLGIIFNEYEHEYCVQLMKDAGIKFSDNCGISEGKTCKTYSYYISNKDTFGDDVREKYGLLPYKPRGENKVYKHLPTEVFKMNKEQFLNFMHGWVCADGYYGDYSSRSSQANRKSVDKCNITNRDQFVLFTSSKECAYEVKVLLESFGIRTSIHIRTGYYDGSRDTVNVKPGYYTSYAVYTRHGSVPIPISKEYREELEGKYRFLRGLSHRLNIQDWMVRELNIEPLVKDVEYDEVVSIESDGISRVYDLEVPGPNSFIANGFSVHNCTTEPNKLLPTIRSRSLELEFSTVPKEEIVKNLTTVSEQRSINLPDEIKLIIADRSAGHMRNAHMLLDKYLLLGEEDFKDSVRSSITLYCKYLVACYMNDKENVLKYINELMNIPKDDLQSDWNTVLTESMRGYTGFEIRHQDIQTLVNVYKSDFNVVVSCYFSPWIKNAFIDMCYFQATFLNMYLVISQTITSKKGTTTPQVQQPTNSRVLVR